MSATSDMWNRFFCGSKYEAKYKWHQSNRRAQAADAVIASSIPTEPPNYIAHGDRPQPLDDRVFE